ncbi:kinase-like domain-containing protein [Dichotomopilus funicola]|uniref:Kinase-like domain-containing protein n=1 Tax=Dichotomopilus funicola TaxID=1934379 RepID=A0AAN6ZK06_9PEZI|nr:kinase-like domain-containing protein [Dichotomopilus funicola]
MCQQQQTLPHHAWLYRHTTLVMQELVENVECYVPGGYHPTDIGDTIANGQDSYTVAHKLGHGAYSTVWLVKRQRKHCVGQQDPPPVSFHALKIFRSNIGNMRGDNELHFLQRLGQVGKFGHPNIAMVEDSFTILGPNGQHQCLVSPVLGLTLHSISTKNAVAFLHSHGICHSDLTLSHIAIAIPDIQSVSESRLLELLGPIKDEPLRLRKGPVPRSKHGPKRVVAAASFSGPDLSSLTSIRVIDFGCAFLSSSPPPTLGCPVDFFPPELLFGYPATTHSDVWQLAALLYYIYANHYMFQSGLQIYTLLVRFIVQHYGPVPSNWRGKYWYNGEMSVVCFEEFFAEGASYLSAVQRDELTRLLRDMVTWEPSRRISAAEAHQRLQSPALSSMQ